MAQSRPQIVNIRDSKPPAPEPAVESIVVPEPTGEPQPDSGLVPMTGNRALIGQPITNGASLAAQQGLTAETFAPVLTLAEHGFGQKVTAEVAERYVRAEIEKAIRFELEAVGNLLHAERQERFVWVGFKTKRRGKEYKVCLPVDLVAEPVANALAESWAGLREKARQDGRTRRDYGKANTHFETAIEMLHNYRQHLSDEELAFLIGIINQEIVYM